MRKRKSVFVLSLCGLWLQPSSSSLGLSEQDKGAAEKSTLTWQWYRFRTWGCWETEQRELKEIALDSSWEVFLYLTQCSEIVFSFLMTLFLVWSSTKWSRRSFTEKHTFNNFQLRFVSIKVKYNTPFLSTSKYTCVLMDKINGTFKYNYIVADVKVTESHSSITDYPIHYSLVTDSVQLHIAWRKWPKTLW